MLTLSDDMVTELAAAIDAARRLPTVGDDVAFIYAELTQRIAARQPRCNRSGECCRFEQYGHRLFVTTVELAAFANGLKPGEADRLSDTPGEGCVFQIAGSCSVHTVRPFGCRMFFCDPDATDWQHEQYEYFHLQLRQIHERLSVPYRYVEWRQGLRALARLSY